MEQILAFTQGPLFRLAFAILVIGLLRRFVLTIWPAVAAWYRARNRNIQWSKYFKDLGSWLFPVTHASASRRLFSAVSYIFHIGLILVPIFLSDHVSLWAKGTGISLPALPETSADILTIVTIAGAAFLLIARFVYPLTQRFSSFEDYAVISTILFVFLTGYVAGRPWNPISYNAMLLLHILSGEVLMIAIPFTKLAHCILFPFTRLCTELGAKLASDVDYVYVSPITKGKSS